MAAAGRNLMRMVRRIESMDEVLVLDTYRGNRTGTTIDGKGVNINFDEFPSVQGTVLLAHELGHADHRLSTGDAMPGHLNPWSKHTRVSTGFENDARRYYGCRQNRPWLVVDWLVGSPSCR